MKTRWLANLAAVASGLCVTSAVLGSDPHAAAPQHAAHAPAPAPAAHDDLPPQVTPADAIQRLRDGNDRFRYGEAEHPRTDAARRTLTFAQGQSPFAAILACADSRVPVELLFDQGIGDLFVVRVAGNVADEDEIGTMEYGVDHLNVPLIVVLGHTKCGAVTAVAQGAHVTGHIARLVDNIGPAVETVKAGNPDVGGARLIRLATRANVYQSMHDLLTNSQTVAAAVRDGKVRVVGGVYDLQSGMIEWLGEHPQQTELLADTAATDGKKELLKAAPSTRPAHAVKKSEKPHADATTDEHDAAHPGDPSGKKPGHRDPAPTGHGEKSEAPMVHENWYALGGLLAVSTIASFAAIHFIYGRAS
jgi:carbonic anhydrase